MIPERMGQNKFCKIFQKCKNDEGGEDKSWERYMPVVLVSSNEKSETRRTNIARRLAKTIPRCRFHDKYKKGIVRRELRPGRLVLLSVPYEHLERVLKKCRLGQRYYLRGIHLYDPAHNPEMKDELFPLLFYNLPVIAISTPFEALARDFAVLLQEWWPSLGAPLL